MGVRVGWQALWWLFSAQSMPAGFAALPSKIPISSRTIIPFLQVTKSSSSWGNASVDTSSHQWGGPGDWPREGLRCAPTAAPKYNWELKWLWTDKGWGLALCYSLSRLTQDWKASYIRSSDLRGTHTVHLGMMRSQRSWRVHGDRRLCLPLSAEPLVVFFRFNHHHQTVNKIRLSKLYRSYWL